jgi:hypothetical protein
MFVPEKDANMHTPKKMARSAREVEDSRWVLFIVLLYFLLP